MKEKLKEQLMLYIFEFELKHGIDFDHAVGGDLMGVIAFGDTMFFNISDIIEDIDNEYPEGLILRWNDDVIDHHPKYINLKSYVMGARF